MGTVDCFLIGHNEMSFSGYERSVRVLGSYSEAYLDLNMSFIVDYTKKYTFLEAF